MASMTHGATSYLLSGAFYRMAHVAWGDPSAPTVVCVHGLTRTGRDFDALAETLAKTHYVICPDLPGRGASDWLPDPALYQPLTYVAALAHLLAPMTQPVQWVGTSLGGICGMLTASLPGQPITRMVLNDIGPFIPAAALRRIRDYIGRTPEFMDIPELERHLRTIHAPFGPLTDPQWAHLAHTSARQREDGRWMLHYDPAIATPIVATEPVDVDLWRQWSSIHIPMLAIRGESSDLLLPETLDQMTKSGTEAYTVTDTGHAPALMDGPTIDRIRAFLVT